MNSLILQQACDLLNADEVVGIPTETVYGLAANAFSEKALTKIFEAKGRPTSDPLILHIPQSWNSVSKLVEKGLINLDSFSDHALHVTQTLMAQFWPGPLTLVLPKAEQVPSLATSGLPTVAIRMPRHPLAQALLEALQLPLAAPSANRFGRISPTQAKHVTEELGAKVKLVLDGGPCAVGLESTVVRVHSDGCVTLLRPGGISKEALVQVVGENALVVTPEKTPQKNFESPGLLLNHYAPVKPLHLFQGTNDLAKVTSKTKQATCIAVLWNRLNPEALHTLQMQLPNTKILSWNLSENGNLEQCAQNLFELLRTMDQSAAEILFAEMLSTKEGLALAIQDRLTKASFKN